MENELVDLVLPSPLHDEPSLPAVPPFSGTYNHPRSRKRPFIRSRESTFQDDDLAYAIHTSSDPALFSNDETPDAENYSPGMKRRKKKTYKGTWWGEERVWSRKSSMTRTNGSTDKRQFRRNFDSGIFMDDSSATDLSSEGILEQELLDAQEKDTTQKTKLSATIASDGRPNVKSARRHAFKAATAAALKRMPQSCPINPKDHIVQLVVQKCLANNSESVDWTGMDLEHLPPGIANLKSLIKRINPGAIVSDELAPFEARLKVYLGNNKFSQLPQPLLELTDIQILSLRQNNLSEIPPGIRSLVNLEELNIASNSLSYLPFELLHLVQYQSLRTVHDSPNPWMPIPAMEEQFCDAPTALIDVANKNVSLYRVAISQPVEFRPDGTQQKYSKDGRAINKQPHLTEVVLRALSRHNAAKADLSSYLSSEHPEPVRKLLAKLFTTQITGGRSCTFCKRNMILARYQWYEWWDISSSLKSSHIASTIVNDPQADTQDTNPGASPTYDKLLPFQRMACGCVDVTKGMRNELVQLKEAECSSIVTQK